MTDEERFAAVKQIFLDVVDLPAERQEAEIRQRSQGDDRVLTEVLSLLKHEDAQTLIQRRNRDTRISDGHSVRTTKIGSSVLGRRKTGLLQAAGRAVKLTWVRWFIWSALLQIFLIYLAYVGWQRNRDSTERLVREGLSTTLQSQSAAIEVWLDARYDEALSLAGNPQLVEATSKLVDVAVGLKREPTAEDFLTCKETKIVKSILGKFAPEQKPIEASILDPFTYGLADERGWIVSASSDRDVGKRLTAAGRAVMARVFDGETIVVPPKPTGGFVPGYEANADDPRLWILTPVAGPDGKAVAVLGAIYRVHNEFTRILRAGRGDRFVDTYLFNGNGMALSEVRHIDFLKEIGLIPDSKGIGSGQRLTLRDPFRDLREHPLPKDMESKPLTFLVRKVLSEKQADSSQVYRDYRGVFVVGSGKWLERYGVGVATEIDVSELDASTAIWSSLIKAQFGLLGLTTVAPTLWGVWRRYRWTREKRTMIGDYAVIRKLEEGGMGTVFLCEHPRLQRTCAVKLLKPERANFETRARLEREAQLASTLSHAHTVHVFDLGTTEEGLPFMVMEYIDGETLYKLTKDKPMPAERMLGIWAQIVGAVGEAHRNGILHRDIKPQNIMLCTRGGETDFTKLLDFGLVKDMESRLDELTTQSVMLMGTPRYMAPERFANPHLVDVRSDIYGLGVLGYRMLAGRDPFEFEDAAQVFEAIVNHTPPLPSQFSPHPIPAPVEELVMQCLKKSPDDRPPDCESLLKAIATQIRSSTPTEPET